MYECNGRTGVGVGETRGNRESGTEGEKDSAEKEALLFVRRRGGATAENITPTVGIITVGVGVSGRIIAMIMQT